jgi:hypothetical protein
MTNEVIMGFLTGGVAMLFVVILAMILASHAQRKENRIRTLEDTVFELKASVARLSEVRK